jgi:type III secretion system (T3SS) SseB-like protein
MTFPSNDLEEGLQSASEGRTLPQEFLIRLFQSDVIVLDLPTSDGERYLGTITMDDQQLVPVFTSLEQAQLSGLLRPESHALAGVLREIMATQPVQWGIAVNPGGTLGLPIPAEVVRSQLERPHTVPVGTTVRLGEPAVEPTALLVAITDQAESMPAVRGLSRCWAQVGDHPPGLVVGVDLDPDSAEARAAIIRAMDGARAMQHPDFTVDIAFWTDGGAFVEWMQQNVEPFYRRGADA